MGVDAWLHFNTWQSRIKIGRYTNDTQWKAAVQKRALQWLAHMPVAKLTDNSRLILWDIIRGNYKRSTIQIWQKAALFIGLTDVAEATQDTELRVALKKAMEGQFTVEGTWKIKPKEMDWVMMAHAIIRVHWQQFPQKYEPAFDETYALILSLKGEDGLIAYKSHMPNYRYVDTLGFICPFLTHYGLQFNHPEAIALAYQQLDGFHQHGMMAQEFLPCHTYQTKSKLPVGLFGWGRGLAWYAYGIMDMYLALPENHPYKESLAQKIQLFTASAIKYQNANGSWNWLLFDASSRNDSSTTAVMGWVLSALPESLSSNATESALQKAKTYLQSVTQRNGAIDFSQGDTKAIGIHAQTFEILPFTQGFALRMMAHITYAKRNSTA
jgi:unsaturated rhamnogalacturonyl hydrolase